MALRWKVKLNWVEALLLDGGGAGFVVFKKAHFQYNISDKVLEKG